MIQIDPAGLDLENLPHGYAVDFVYVPKVGKPCLVYNTLPFEFRAEAFRVAIEEKNRARRPFALPVVFKAKPMEFVTETCCRW